MEKEHTSGSSTIIPSKLNYTFKITLPTRAHVVKFVSLLPFVSK
jgi:hypothetical protein